MNKVLTLSLVKSFYQANTGFFLITLGLVFGFLKTPQHIDIATALAYSPLYYVIPFGLFVLYTFKTLQFCYTVLRLPSYQFLSYLVTLPALERASLVISVQTKLLLPVIAYSGLLIYTAVQHQLWWSAAIVVSGNLLLIFGAAHFLNQRLVSSQDPKRIKGLSLWTNKLPRTLSTLFIHHLFNRQAILLLGTKLVSLAIIIGAITIYSSDPTDHRVPLLGMLLSAAINSPLCIHHQRFEQVKLDILKNLPLSTNNRFLTSFFTYFLLFIPEIIVLIFNTATLLPPASILGGILMPLALMSFYDALLYPKQLSMEQFMKYPFFITAVLFFVILGYIPIYLIAVVSLLIAYIIFRFSYNRFEMTINDD